MSSEILDARALIIAAERFNISPFPGEDTANFALRVARAHNDREGNRRLLLGVRIGISAALLALGIGGF